MSRNGHLPAGKQVILPHLQVLLWALYSADKDDLDKRVKSVC